MHLLFTNTGVQIICIPLNSTRRYSASQIGYGWQHCCMKATGAKGGGDASSAPRDIPFVQWQVIQGQTCRLFLAIDTSLGDTALGHVCALEALAGDYHVSLDGVLDLTGEVLPSVPSINLCFRAAAATTGDAVAVDLVVDFGNSRSGALLLEASAETGAPVKMTPFELLDRYRLDAWNEHGEPQENVSAQWFSSKTRWCNTPFQTPLPRERTDYVAQTVKTFWRRKQVMRERRQHVHPDLFEDLSLARIGREADDLGLHINLHGELRLGVSSPKRYLWADDARWLEGAFWYMADPYNRCRSGAFAAKLAGAMLAYLNDDVSASGGQVSSESYIAQQADPIKPRYAPRTLMTAALYELLCQAFCFANSPRDPTCAGDANRSREIRSLSLTYPSGMFHEEREAWRAEAQRAIQIFQQTLGKRQTRPMTLHFGIDEASAVHLAYLWSELQQLGQDPRLWFSLMQCSDPAPTSTQAQPSPAHKVRVACIDIGGGTSNLMIASYECQAGIEDTLQGQVLHRDSVSTAGDQLIKRLLERIIVPALVSTVGFETADALLLFGPEVPSNRGFRAQRIEWMSRLLLPLAEAYLRQSVDRKPTDVISHTDPAIVDSAILESLGTICNQLRGVGYYNLWQDLKLHYDAERFDAVASEVFDELLSDYCERIAAHEVDVVLLAGQPTKLEPLCAMIRSYLPLPDARIIPMHQYYAGNWYPYQAADGGTPGRIADPKSAVVVGAAVHFLTTHGCLPQFRFQTRDAELNHSYCWGVLTDGSAQLRSARVLFRNADVETRDAIEFKVTSQRLLIGRTASADLCAPATPIYQLRIDTADRVGPIDVNVHCADSVPPVKPRSI